MRLDGGIVELYQDGRVLMTCAEIASRYDVSRSGVRRHLKHQGVNVSKEKIEVKCAYCGATLHRDRADVRKTRDQFCDQEHYRAFIRSPEYQKARIAQIMAKKVYARLGHSEPRCIMFLDNDIHNLNPSNLLGFRSRRDMAMYDIGEEVEAFLCASGTWEPIQKGSL